MVTKGARESIRKKTKRWLARLSSSVSRNINGVKIHRFDFSESFAQITWVKKVTLVKGYAFKKNLNY